MPSKRQRLSEGIKYVTDSVPYILAIVVIALVSLFVELPAWAEYSVDGIFVADLLAVSLVYTQSEGEKSVGGFLKQHVFDIIACVPVSGLDFFKIIRLVRIVRLVKLRKLAHSDIRFTVSSLLSFSTMRSLAVYLLIYFIGNVYAFSVLEDRSALDATYWLAATVTSVGYGDITPTTPLAKLLAIVLMFVGVAAVSYVNAVLINAVVNRTGRHADGEVVKDEQGSGPDRGELKETAELGGMARQGERSEGER